MRELDLLLEEFLGQRLDSLDERQLLALESLLENPDQDILAWLSRSREAPPDLKGIVETICTTLD